MNDNEFEALVKKLKKINTVISSLDPVIQKEAFDLLRPWLRSRSGVDEGAPGRTGSEGDADAVNAFFGKHPSGKPSENVNVICAFLYSQYGSEFSEVGEIKSTADEVGLTIPARVDMTLRQAKDKGKALFQVSKRRFRPTVHGENFLKTKYKVSKGRRKRTQELGEA